MTARTASSPPERSTAASTVAIAWAASMPGVTCRLASRPELVASVEATAAEVTAAPAEATASEVVRPDAPWTWAAALVPVPGPSPRG